MDLVAKLSTIVPDPGCIYEAIEPILANCESPENVVTRTRIAVDLALCELNAAGVTYPTVCKDPLRLTECTRQLESKPTWWTTFSGQYRYISLVCNEHQPIFASQKVVSVFNEAYDVYVEHKGQFNAELVQLQKLKDETTGLLQSVTSDLASVLATIQSQTQEIVSGTDISQERVVKLNKFLEQSLLTTGKQSVKLASLSTVFERQITSFDDKFVSFSNLMADFQNKHEATALTLSQSANHTVQVLKHADRTLSETAAILRAIGKVFTFFGLFLGPLGAATIVLGAIFFLWKVQRNKSVDVMFL